MAYKQKRTRKVHTAKWDRCVKKISKKGTAVNPFAVCTAKIGKSSFTTKR